MTEDDYGYCTEDDYGYCTEGDYIYQSDRTFRYRRPLKIFLFGGTTEGRELSWIMTANENDVTVSVATGLGEELLTREDWPPNDELFHIMVGRMSSEQMQRALEGFDMCFDATHPYAVEVTANIKEACRKAGVPYYRVARKKADKYFPGSQIDDIVDVESAEEACQILAKTEGNILLTTGSKELGAFAEIPRERLYVRVLPTRESIEACEAVGIPHRNIIAMIGPFTRKLNEALLEQFHISFLVTKDGGKNGGFEEKLNAALHCGVNTLVIKRPEESGLGVEEAVEIVRKKKN